MNTKTSLQWLLILVIAFTFGACAKGVKTSGMSEMEDADAKYAEIQDRERTLTRQEARLTEEKEQIIREEARLAADKKKLQEREMKLTERTRELQFAKEEAQTMVIQKESPMSKMAGSESLFPPNAKLGECYARVFVPHRMQTVSERVLKRDASERIEIIPAKFETVDEKILVEEASQRLEVIPATYDWVYEKVMAEPAKKALVEIPAIYETVSENVLVKPAHTVWEKGRGPIQRIDESTGEIMCLVEVPAEYRTVTKRVLKSPAATKEVETPAVYKTVKRKVMKSPPTTRIVEIPAKYETIQVTKLTRPAQEKRIGIPAEYQTVTKQQVASDEHMEWRSILCETNMTRSKITDIQIALKEKGFEPGSADGVVGSKTMSAVNEFQRKNGLLVSKYLTLNTLKALGVNPQ